MERRAPPDHTSLLTVALRAILRPLVRVLMVHGVTAPAFYRIVKETYVDVSAHTLGVDSTDSRISVMTGVHRRDVKDMRALRQQGAGETPQKASILATVVGRWLGADDTTDANGDPLALPKSGAVGVTFETLVQSVSRDIRPRTVLDELIRQNIVTQIEDTVHLRRYAFIGSADLEQRLHFFAANLGDHMDAAADNVMADTPHNLERAVFYNNLSDQSIAAIEAEARRLSHDALLTLNAQARALQDSDIAAQTNTHRFRFGMFFFNAPMDDGTARQTGTQGKDDHDPA